MSIELIVNSIAVKKALDNAAIAWLHDASHLIESQAKQNTKVDTEQLKGSWQSIVDEQEGIATIGSPLENAIWEEFGTGEYALNGDGRKSAWYVDADKIHGKKRPSFNGKVVKVYGKNGKVYYKTNGKKPRRALFKAFETKKTAVIKRAEEIFKSEV